MSTSKDMTGRMNRHMDSASALDTNDFMFDKVELDAVVLMKIIKHTNDEGEDFATGSLVGLINNKALEVTNCFALPPVQNKPNAMTVGLTQTNLGQQQSKFDVDMEQYQSTMVSFFRDAKLDYMQVGFYQSVTNNSSNTEYMTAMYEYHNRESANIAIFYDPWKSNSGFIHLKAFRLTRKARESGPLYEMLPEKIASMNLIFKDLFEELPIYIKKSTLSNLYINQLSQMYPSDEKQLVANTPLILERGLSELYSHVDHYSNETTALSQYSKNLRNYNQQKEQLLLQRQKENELRRQKGEPPLSEEINNILPQFSIPDRKKSFLSGNDVIKSCHDLHDLLIQSAMKLYTLQEGLAKST